VSALDSRISVEAVRKCYETPAGVVRALEGVSLVAEPGSSLAIMGPSGCGKSTLLGLIGGLETPSSGRVEVAGEEISALPASERARLRRQALGLVFQADNLLPFLTAVENVGLQLALCGAKGGDERCLEVLSQLGLDGVADKLPDQLSGGERQRVAVARAVVHGPRVILADEPTGSLDAANSATVIEVLLAARRLTGATLLVVTHDVAVASRLERAVRLRDGRLADPTASNLRPEPRAANA
jgi:putative ABC transport system ATP-binding protein